MRSEPAASRPRHLLSQHDLRRVAVEAECDTRTVERYLTRAPLRRVSEAAVREACRRCGFEPERVRAPVAPEPASAHEVRRAAGAR